MSHQIIQGNTLALPLADHTVDLIITSPPYFALRSYTDGGAHYAGQLGSEATPGEFVDALLAATREMIRVTKPTGSIWINLGDCYSGGNSGDRNNGFNERYGNASGRKVQQRSQNARPPMASMRPKSLIGVPWRYALRCIDELGLILRAEIIWSKPNGLPESVTDRVRRSHEQWFHFTLSPRYFSAVDEIREEYSERVQDRQKYAGRADVSLSKDRGDRHDGNPARGILGHGHKGLSPLGKLPGSVWTIPSQPLIVPGHLGVDHFAAFPMEWPRRLIKGWAPTVGVCTVCGEGRRPVADKTLRPLHEQANNRKRIDLAEPDGNSRGINADHRVIGVSEVTITGYACACPDTSAPTTPAIILDPFGGTGTTALVADTLGCHGISIDMSGDYCRLAQWRCNDPNERARAMQVDKPTPQTDGQQTLFEVSA